MTFLNLNVNLNSSEEEVAAIILVAAQLHSAI